MSAGTILFYYARMLKLNLLASEADPGLYRIQISSSVTSPFLLSATKKASFDSYAGHQLPAQPPDEHPSTTEAGNPRCVTTQVSPCGLW